MFGTGIEVVPNLPKCLVPNVPKCPVPVIPAVYTGGMPRYVPYRTHPWNLIDLLRLFPERARLAPPWPLASSHLNTASVYYLLDLSSFSLLSTLFWYFRVLVFYIVRIYLFFIFFASSVSSCTRAAAAATQPTAIQQHHNNSSRYIQ